MYKTTVLKTSFLILNICVGLSVNARQPKLPESVYNLRLKAPVSTWDEALPLGNGLTGGLLLGEQNTIRLSLDRGDLWDERTHGEKEWWKKYTYQKGADLIAITSRT